MQTPSSELSSSPVSHVLYLHGFRSSPQSFKAQLLARHIEALRQRGLDLTWWCPALPPSPTQAMQLVMEGLRDWPAQRLAVIGSSLGGFYAGVLAERLDCRAVLLNPAVYPARDLARYIGEQTSYHDPQDRFFFRSEFIAEFEALAPQKLTRLARYFAVIAQGDEVLDWREMAQWCAGCHIKTFAGGDHALSDFEQAHLPDVLRFLGLPAGSCGQDGTIAP